MTHEQILGKIAELDTLLLYLAGEELRASRGHRPGEHPERYEPIRREARYINAMKRDWFNLMPPPHLVRSIRITDFAP